MARMRTIKPEFWTGEDIVECSRDARLLFIGLWSFADDGGVQPYSLKRFKMQVFPADFDIDAEIVRRMIDELSSNDQLTLYEIEKKKYIQIVNWSKHQKTERPSYRYPQPDGVIPPSFSKKTKPIRRTITEGTPPIKEKEKEKEKSKEPPMVPPRTKSTAIKNQKTPMPDIFTPSKACRVFATGNNIDIDFEFDQFKNHSRANGKQFVNWQAAFRTWLGNTVKFAAGKPKAKILADDEDPTKDWVYS